MQAESAIQAAAILRDSSLLQWYVVPLFALCVYVYANEIEKRNWSMVFAGLAFWGMDWFNEIWNGLVFHFTQFAPVWGTPGKTAYVILIGLNIEICFMFAIAGIGFSKMLPADKKMKILGIPNRIAIGLGGSIFSVAVEYFLNSAGLLTWEYSWWNRGAPYLIVLFGYLHFFLVSFWVFDMESTKKQIITVGIIYTFDIICLILFMGILGWI